MFIQGLNTILTVCDTTNTNATAVNALVSPNGPSQAKKQAARQTGALMKYTINGRQIIHCWDPSHLIKVVRNNLEVKNIAHFISKRWQSGDEETIGQMQIATWDHLQTLFEIDNRLPQRRLKLTDEHLKPSKYKMKVSHAAQVFSATCGNTMLEYVEKGIIKNKHFCHTAQLLLFMNDLFDSINGSEKNGDSTLKSTLR